MFPGDKYDYESAKAINKYKYVKGVLLVVASVAFAIIVFWPSFKSYLTISVPKGIESSSFSQKVSQTSIPATEIKNSAKDIRFFGTDKSNQPYLLIADGGQENHNGIVNMEKPQLTLNLKSGNIATLTATAGNYDKNKDMVMLTGEVIVTHSAGYQFVTTVAWIDLTQSFAYGDQPIQGTGPNGTIQAIGGFRLSDKEDKISFLGRPELILKSGKN